MANNVLQFTAFALSDDDDSAPLPTDVTKVLGLRPLLHKEAEGLDALVSFFRTRGEETSSATRFYRFTYLRGGNKIGEELFVGFSLASDLTDLARETARGLPVMDDDYARVAERNGLTRTEMGRMVTFGILEMAARDESTPADRPKK